MVYLVAHFGGILAYAWPGKEDSKAKAIVFPYIYPYFHQSWSMFVPIPKQNYNIYIRDMEHDWQDVFSETLNKHQSNRLNGSENLFLSLVGSVHYYAASVGENSFVKNNDGSNPNLRVLQKVLVGYMFSKYGKQPVKMDIIIKIQDLPTSKTYAHYYKN